MGTLTYSTQEVQAKLDSIDLIDAKFGTYPRPDLLDNWYLVGGGSQQGGGQFPINSLGQTSYTGANQPAVDRWHIIGSQASVSLQSDCLLLSVSTTTHGLKQSLGADVVSRLAGQTVTMSILTGAVSGSIRITDTNNLATVHKDVMVSGNAVTTYTFTVNGSASGGGVFVWGGANSSVEIIAVKLELGSTQTLAHQENGVWVLNEIPNYQQELEKCQRYQIELVSPGNSAIGCVGGGTPTSTTQCYVFVPTPTELRTVPTLSYAGTWKLVREGTAPASGAAVSAMSVVNRSANGVTLQITSSGLSTSYRYDLWYTAADTTNKLLLNANL